GGQRRRELAERAGTRVELLLVAGARVVELACGAVAAAMQLAAKHEPGAEAGPDRDEHEVVDAARDAAPLLAERRQVDVVLELHRALESRAELRREGIALEAGDVLDEADPAVALDRTGHAEHYAVEELHRYLGVAEEREHERWDRGERRVRRRLGPVDVAPAAHLGRQVAHGSPDEPRAEVDAEHERSAGVRLEEDGAIPRAVARGLGLADETGPQERLQ